MFFGFGVFEFLAAEDGRLIHGPLLRRWNSFSHFRAQVAGFRFLGFRVLGFWGLGSRF